MSKLRKPLTAAPAPARRHMVNLLIGGCLVLVLVLIVLEVRVPLFSRDTAEKTQAAADDTPPKLNPATPPGPTPAGMVWVPGGEFWMGSDDGPPDERPRHKVYVDGFWMDQTEVTNAQFAKFAAATGYK